VYSGDYVGCQAYFGGVGMRCPEGYNLADYLIDMTTRASMEPRSSSNESLQVDISPASDDSTNLGDEERGLLAPHHVPLSVRSLLSANLDEETELQTRPASAASSTGGYIATSTGNYIKRKTSQLLDAVSSGSRKPDVVLAPQLAALVQAYADSEIATRIRREMEEVRREAEAARNGGAQRNGDGHVTGELPDVVMETSLLRGRKRASWGTQFRILSGRAFKNLYRDPALLAAHYLSAVGLAVICGLFFHDVTNDIAGFQNRLGIFFFTLALFGFSCLSSLGLFANERILFMRERANGYYSSFTYFASKVLFDILPLRLVPPLMFGGIVYGLVGLVPTVAGFWKFILTLVLFNLTTASVVLWLSIAFDSVSVASLVGTLVMLFNLLFTGLLINRETVAPALRWLHTISFFHAAFEALAVNELRYLQLKEIKYGVELDLPAATILSVFGLRAQSFWWPNISLLGIFFVVFTTGSYLTLHFFVKEKR
jgi:ABC-type multidrug transport system permease subunit